MPTKQLSYFSLVKKLASDSNNKKASRQLLEMLLLYLRSRLGPGYYFLAQMYRKDVSLNEVLGYLSVRQYNKKVFQLNSRLYHRCSQNKVVEKAVLTAYGIPTPELLGHYHPANGLTASGEYLRAAEDIEQLLNQQQAGSKLCFKLTEAWGGEGFRAIECLASQQVKDLSNQNVTSVASFAKSLCAGAQGGVLIERYLDQHAGYAAFNSSSVNTLRVFVVQRDSGHVECVGAFLRVGGAGSLVDNMTAGGLSFPVDLETGVLKSGIHKYKLGGYYDSHPDTHQKIAGTQLPFFKEVVELTAKAMLAFPETRFVGADIAVSNDGPVVLELNIQPDYNGFAYIRAPSRKALSTH